MDRVRILIVEDEAIIAKNLQSQLRGAKSGRDHRSANRSDACPAG